MIDRMKNISDNVKRYREFVAMTQAEFDNWLGVKVGSTGRLERNLATKVSYIFALEDRTRISFQAWKREMTDAEMLDLIGRANV